MKHITLYLLLALPVMAGTLSAKIDMKKEGRRGDIISYRYTVAVRDTARHSRKLGWYRYVIIARDKAYIVARADTPGSIVMENGKGRGDGFIGHDRRSGRLVGVIIVLRDEQGNGLAVCSTPGARALASKFEVLLLGDPLAAGDELKEPEKPEE